MTKKIPKNRQNEQYWLNREKQQQAYIDKNLASDEQYNKIIQAQYDSLLADINKRIDSELSKLANENGISIADMRAKVSQTDIKQFEAEAKRVVAQADKMRKQGKSPKLADWSQEVNDRLKLYNATMRINRLEYLKAGIGLDMITAGLQVDSELRDKLFKDATEEQKRQAGILGENNAHIDTLAIGNIILAKTKSNDFSQRIWTNMDVLQAKLSQTIMAGITTGQSYDEMARRLKTQVSKDIQNVTYVTQRIARTEATRVQTEITMNSLKRNGYDFCKWYKEPSACHDCALIGNQDNGWGKGIYKVKDVPTIPVHPNCRCAVGAYWVDEEDIKINSPIPFKNILDKLKSKKYTETFSNYPNNIDYYTSLFATENMKKVLGVNRAKEISYRLSMAPDKYQKLYLRNKDKIIFASDLNDNKVNNYFLRTDKKIHLKSDAFTNKYGNRYDIVFHEIAHAIDFFNNEISVNSSYNIGEVIRKEVIKNVDILIAEKSPQLIGVPKDSKAFSIALNNSIFSYENVTSYTGLVADIYKAVSGVELSYGHESGYFDEPGNLEREFFAGAISMEINNASGAEFNRIIFPESLKIIDEMVDSLLESE
ncbi:minor capsid protein [Ligilactobacillus salivarius]|uniref:minor capsid protein n=1 Tax=Ligilactobacillus salivarius TaxID=1624 RepID=UPI0025A42A10|nr:minor capsid protein [Ligilactobacillus salivarius]MDM8222961.1 minor capsid protein [Ligilactobacillus salivarius]